MMAVKIEENLNVGSPRAASFAQNQCSAILQYRAMRQHPYRDNLKIL